MLNKIFLPMAMSLLLPMNALAGSDPVAAAVAGEHRTPAYTQRDEYRHPAQTLEFFDVRPGQHIVEILPGGGWYTELLAPIVADEGKLYVAIYSDTAENQPAYRARLNAALRDKLASDPELYGNVEITHLHVPGETDIAPAGSADRLLTFRNVHNFVMAGTASEAFAAFYRALKPGGIFGVVDHRAPAGASDEFMRSSGYVTEERVKALAAEAGFEFIAASEINANPGDTADHPHGVWSLPPTLRGGDEDRDKYLAIGESDRMTLKFRKPE